MQEFLLFVAVGFAAQIVDGALGMAFGVISSTLLLSMGTPPAVASASVHAAKMFTGTASALSHLADGNVRWALFWPLGIGGVIGGVVGGLFLTSVDGALIKPWVLGWLALMGLIILVRSAREIRLRHVAVRGALPLGLVGGFLDALGGGGWGPTVTTTLVSVGVPPRQAVGSGNTAEAFVAMAVSTTFVVVLLTGHGRDLENLTQYGTAVLGLITGGVTAAPLAARIARTLPVKPFAGLIGLLILLLAAIQLAGPLLDDITRPTAGRSSSTVETSTWGTCARIDPNHRLLAHRHHSGIASVSSLPKTSSKLSVKPASIAAARASAWA